MFSQNELNTPSLLCPFIAAPLHSNGEQKPLPLFAASRVCFCRPASQLCTLLLSKTTGVLKWCCPFGIPPAVAQGVLLDKRSVFPCWAPASVSMLVLPDNVGFLYGPLYCAGFSFHCGIFPFSRGQLSADVNWVLFTVEGLGQDGPRPVLEASVCMVKGCKKSGYPEDR